MQQVLFASKTHSNWKEFVRRSTLSSSRQFLNWFILLERCCSYSSSQPYVSGSRNYRNARSYPHIMHNNVNKSIFRSWIFGWKRPDKRMEVSKQCKQNAATDRYERIVTDSDHCTNLQAYHIARCTQTLNGWSVIICVQIMSFGVYQCLQNQYEFGFHAISTSWYSLWVPVRTLIAFRWFLCVNILSLIFCLMRCFVIIFFRSSKHYNMRYWLCRQYIWNNDTINKRDNECLSRHRNMI